jgi:diaminopimelate decarboxylase/aspartate kinase
MDDRLTEAEFGDSASLGAPAEIAASPWTVMKFGGTSVSTAQSWATIAGLIRNRLADGLHPVIVHSALKGVSNALEETLQEAAAGKSSDGLAQIRKQHYELAESLGIDGAALLDDRLHELDQLVAGVRLVREVSVRVRVRIMAIGELMATCLGAEYLRNAGLPVVWVDARDFLTSVSSSGGQRALDYLSAKCDANADADFQERLKATGEVILTQGFIARNEWGETVLLGRGGSDTSASYFAALLQARRLEIWTDVPGMFTADPHVVPSARLLLSLHYDEAQELASAGSSVLHPRCLSPLRDSAIPLYIRCTTAPDISGTVVSSITEEVEPQRSIQRMARLQKIRDVRYWATCNNFAGYAQLMIAPP